MIRIMKDRRSWIALTATTLLLTAFLGVGLAQSAPDQGMSAQLRLLRDLIGLIDDVNKIASSPSASGVAAVMSVKDQIKSNEDTIAYLERLLPQTSDPAVQRAIRIQLADLYKNTGQREKALAHLERLITNRPGVN